MQKLLTLWSNQDWVFVLLVTLVIKAIVLTPSFSEGLIIGILSAYQAFKHYVYQLKIKPLDESLKKELADLKTRISRIESKDSLERLATTQSSSSQPSRKYF